MDDVAGVNVPARVKELEMKMLEMRREIAEIWSKREPEPVQEDWELLGPDGPVRLSALFGDRRDLIVVHNMGKG